MAKKHDISAWALRSVGNLAVKQMNTTGIEFQKNENKIQRRKEKVETILSIWNLQFITIFIHLLLLFLSIFYFFPLETMKKISIEYFFKV